MSDGVFISFEGIDGAGKSSHVEPLAQALRAAGRTVHVSREPGGTPLAESLRELLLTRPMDPMTEGLLAFAARRDHLQTVIEPALAQGDTVLSDRFADASFAYQGGGRGLSQELLTWLERWVQGDGVRPPRQPDLTLWFDLDPAEAARRLAGARAPDRFENESLAFFGRVREVYRARQAANPTRIVRLDASQTPAQVWDVVQTVVRARGWLP